MIALQPRRNTPEAAPIAARDSRRLAAAGLKAFFRIGAAWGLSTTEEMRLLGDPSRATFFKWKREPATANPGRDTLERISCILGIYKSLQILLPDPAVADAWVHKANTAFAGRTALERMLAGNVGDLYAVRRYLDAARGGWA